MFKIDASLYPGELEIGNMQLARLCETLASIGNKQLAIGKAVRDSSSIGNKQLAIGKLYET